MNWQNRIIVDPQVCHGKACTKGSRVMVSVVLDNLASNVSRGLLPAGGHVIRVTPAPSQR